MNENIAFIGLIGTALVGMAGAGIYAVKTLKNTSPVQQDGVLGEDVDNAQGFVPIVDIREGVLELNGHRYRAILECSSVNYDLKTEGERDVIELAFQNFISSLSFPITFHIQTRVIDNTLIVRELEKDIENLKVKNPNLVDYGQMYLDSIRSFDTVLGDSRQKRKYIIIPYEESATMNDLNDEEKFEFAIHQMKDRVEFVKNQLASMNIKANRLNNAELIELVYSAYHRDSSNLDMAEFIEGGEFFVPVVMGENRMENITPEKRIDLELVKIQNMIKEEYLSYGNDLNENQIKAISNIHDELKKVRDEIGSPYGNNIFIDKKQYFDKTDMEIGATSNYKYEQKAQSANYSEKVKKIEEDIAHNDFNFSFGDEAKEEIAYNDFDFIFGEENKVEIAHNDFDFIFGEENKVDKAHNDFDFIFGEENKEDKAYNDFDFIFGEETKEEKAYNDFNFSFEEEIKEEKAEKFVFDFEPQKDKNKDKKLIKNEDDFSFDFDIDMDDDFNTKDRLKDLMIFDD